MGNSVRMGLWAGKRFRPCEQDPTFSKVALRHLSHFANVRHPGILSQLGEAGLSPPSPAQSLGQSSESAKQHSLFTLVSPHSPNKSKSQNQTRYLLSTYYLQYT